MSRDPWTCYCGHEFGFIGIGTKNVQEIPHDCPLISGKRELTVSHEKLIERAEANHRMPDEDQTCIMPPKQKGHPEFLKILDQMREVHQKKSADYGNKDDIMANLTASARFGVPPWVATMVRANDKMARIQSFLQNGKLENESVEDSLLDLANYAILALVLFREKK